ncbi:hypothetical protein IE81DRAFT_243958 [Ceraceosorus guamensis]|uniref:Uncharacterized protein n=1 Tax=Ceraceosorus guamensis TaxID=1522189 RepID=A0A316W864_9BASI|nr:hypothetical protein IE81DRAFT_243958 [Ceraceosorus guamensis]PWN44931.1 hypothetical protein IE81DRAFT_243958 [Ceraceosorus guamensis]
MSDAASSGSQDATSSSLRRPALPDRNASQHTVSGMNNQLGQMLRSAALMYDGRQQDSAGQDSSSSSSSSSEEDEDDDGDAKNEALKANRAEAGEASRSSLEWSLRKEEAALADAKDRKHRKAIFEKMDGLRRRKAAPNDRHDWTDTHCSIDGMTSTDWSTCS